MGIGGRAPTMSVLLAENDGGGEKLFDNGEGRIGRSGSTAEIPSLVDGGEIHRFDGSSGTAIPNASARADGPLGAMDDAHTAV